MSHTAQIYQLYFEACIQNGSDTTNSPVETKNDLQI